MGPAATMMWRVGSVPRGPPSKRTSWSRALTPDAEGQGCPGLQAPSISRAAIPDKRMRGPSAHHIGPSPSQTAVGVQVKDVPAAIINALMITRNRSRHRRDQGGGRSPAHPAAQERLPRLSQQCNWHKGCLVSSSDRSDRKTPYGNAAPHSADRCDNRHQRSVHHGRGLVQPPWPGRALPRLQILLKTSYNRASYRTG